MVKEECEHNQPFWECEICGNVRAKRDSFWNSYPIEDLSPEQRKHFKAIMRKEVRK